MNDYKTLGEWFRLGYTIKDGAVAHYLLGKVVYSKNDVVIRKEKDRCKSDRAEAFFRSQK